MSRAAFTDGTDGDRVLAALEHVGGAVTTSELAYQTGLAQSQVVDALSELEMVGHAVPMSWSLGPEAV